jgi:hypothetical protein
MNITTNRIIVLAGFGLLGAAFTASADISTGAGHFESSLGLHANYDSNIFLNRNESSDTSIDMSGSEQYIHDSGILTSATGISFDYTLFNNHTTQDSLDPEFMEKLAYSPSDKTNATAEASFQRSTIANPDLNARTKSNNLMLDGMFQHLWTEKFGYRVLGDYSDDNYLTPGYSDVFSYSAGIDAVYAYSQKLTILSGFEHRESWTAHRPAGQVDPSNKDAVYTVGLEGELAPKLSGTISTGWEKREFNSKDLHGSTAFYLSSELKWVATAKTSVAINGSENFDLTAANQSSKNSALIVSMNHVLDKQWSTDLGFTVSRAIYQGLLASDSRTDDTVTLKSRIVYAWTTNVRLDASLGYTHVDSSQTFSTYDRLYAGIGVTATF